MDLAKQGAEALSNNDAQSAVTQYTKALLVHPTSPDYLIQRSTAFTRLKPPRHDLALKDAELAVLCGRKRASRKHIQLAQLRRVVSLYHNAKYAEAKYILQTMDKWFSKEGDKDKQVQEAMSLSGEKKGVMEAKIWLIKIEKKLKEMPQDEVTEGEYPEAEVDEKKLLNLYKSQLTPEGVFKLDWQLGQENAPLQTPKETTTTPAAASAPSAAPTQTKVRHEWYQNNQSVIITIYAKGVPKDQADIDIQEDSISVTFPQPSDPNSAYSFTLDPLHALIDPSNSKCAIMSTKVEITLRKSALGQKWPALEGTEPLKKTANNTNDDSAAKAAVMSTFTSSQPTTAAPAYPTSSKSGPKNWDKVANDLTAKKPKAKKDKSKAKDPDASDEDEEMDDADSDYGGDAVDGFFKKLYAGADDDTRRAMMKSFQESNGTALSTNWSEVGKGKVEEVKSKDEE